MVGPHVKTTEISLVSIASKVLAAIILHGLCCIRERCTREDQTKSRPGRGCIDRIFTLRLIVGREHLP